MDIHIDRNSPLQNCNPLHSVSGSPAFKVAMHVSTGYTYIHDVIQLSHPNFLFPLGFEEKDFVSLHCIGMYDNKCYKHCLKEAKVVRCWNDTSYEAYAIRYTIKPSYESSEFPYDNYSLELVTRDRCDGSCHISIYRVPPTSDDEDCMDDEEGLMY